MIAAWAARPTRVRSPHTAIRAAGTAIAALVLLAPTVNPWYVAWLVPFYAAVPSPAGFALTLTILLYYAIPPDAGTFAELRWLEFGIPALVAITSARRER